MKKCAIFLSGPIGAGKSTLGRALAERLSGGFIEGDDFPDRNHPWYCSILQTSRAIARTGLAKLESTPAVVIAYPLGCVTYLYFRRRFGDVGVPTHFVSLRASYSSIIARGRGRIFDSEELHRIAIMISEGYGERPFSDLVFDTDHEGFSATLDRLEAEVRNLVEI